MTRKLHAVVADEFVGREDRLIGFGLVVVGDELKLLAEHTASVVDILDCHLGRDLCGFSIGGSEAAQRCLEPDLDIRVRGPGAEHRDCDGGGAKQRVTRATHVDCAVSMPHSCLLNDDPVVRY